MLVALVMSGGAPVTDIRTDHLRPPTDDDLARQQCEVKLSALVFRAKREVPKYGGEDHKTPWDIYHDLINETLTDMVG